MPDTVILDRLTWTEVESALDEGTDTVVCAVGSIEGHGPHLPLLMDTLAPDVAREIDATVHPLADRSTLMELMNEGLAAAGVDSHEPVIHAGAAETAIVLAVAEGLVRTDQLEPGREGPVSTARPFSEGFRAITDNGVLGDPRHATADAGEAILDRITAAYVERIEAER